MKTNASIQTFVSCLRIREAMMCSSLTLVSYCCGESAMRNAFSESLFIMPSPPVGAGGA